MPGSDFKNYLIKLRSLGKQGVELLESPLFKHRRFTAAVALLIMSPVILYTFWRLLSGESDLRAAKDAFALATRAVAHAYLLAIVYETLQRMNRRAGRWFAWAVCGLAALFSAVDIVCYNALHTPFADSFPSMILGSNPAETSDFFTLYFPAGVVTAITVSAVIAAVVVAAVDRLLLKRIKRNRLSRLLSWVLLLFCMAWCYKSTRPYYMGGFLASHGGFFDKLAIIAEFFKTDPVISPADCELVAVSDRKPENIILIIGESFSRDRSSLYGYRMPTNRCLEEYVNDSSMVVYRDVVSPAVVTVEAFKEIMGTFHKGGGDEAYYSCRMVPDVMSKAGYATAWFSNKSRNGFYRNVVRQYAELCDSVEFVGNKFSTGYDSVDGISYDERLIDPVVSYEPARGYNFEVINMIGSHPGFSNRYPNGWSRFDIGDYGFEPESRRILSYQYDTSIAYNDSIVNIIIGHFKDKEAVVIYFPDHGLDVFQSSPDFIGHAIDGNDVSCRSAVRIPFMIWMSHEFQKNFQDLTKRIRASKDKAYNTTDIIYTLMDIAGVKFADNNDVAERSLIR